jgi:fatty-acyl-CoA synthase
VDLRIVNPEMKEVARDGKTTGEIVARAPWLTQGYFNNLEASEQLWAGGYLHTNDIGNIGPPAMFRSPIASRTSSTGGEWVSSLELEDIISQHRGVSDVAVIGIKDEKWGERPLALVVRNPKASAQVNGDDIKSHVKLYADKGVISEYGPFLSDRPLRSPHGVPTRWRRPETVPALVRSGRGSPGYSMTAGERLSTRRMAAPGKKMAA